MTRVTSETMTVIIDGVDYSVYCDSVNVSGGGAMYSFTKMYNGRKKRSVTGYTEYNIELNMLVDTATNDFIKGLSDVSASYTISLGESGVIEDTYSNMYVATESETIEASDGLQTVRITFVGEGIPSNRT